MFQQARPLPLAVREQAMFEEHFKLQDVQASSGDRAAG
jgi:hypothetical protein